MLEVGRLIFMYGTVITAAREAARYGSSTGLIALGGNPRYSDCAGINQAAQNVDFLGVIDNVSGVVISYDHGPGTASFSACPPSPSLLPVTGDRINITVSAYYQPMIPVTPLLALPISSTTARTFLFNIQIEGTVQAPQP
jgi:hypothetical protein